MAARPSAASVVAHLGLVPLEGEGGLYRQTYRLAGAGTAPAATAIYYLLTPETFSEFHRLPSDELYHFYLGDPVALTRLTPDGEAITHMLGADLLAGMAVQRLVPAGDWQGSQLVPGGEYALMGTTMTPGFDPATYERGRRHDLLARYPRAASTIDALTRS